MKKTYTKPEILFEDFSLSTNIASCKYDVTHAQFECGIKFGLDVLFLDSMSGVCTEEPDTPGSYDGYCYHNPSEDNNMFSS